MERYRAYGQEDDQPLVVGDEHFLGVDEYNNPENVQPAYVQKAVNCSFSTMNAETRGGFVCLPELGATPFGQVWTQQTSGTTDALISVAYGNGYFLAVSNTKVLKSTDGITWSTTATFTDLNAYQIAFGNGTFVISGEGLAGASCIRTSTDGVTWSSPATAPTTRVYTVLEYGGNIWVSFASTGYVIYSTNNGSTWSTATAVSGTTNPTGLAYGNGVFILAVTLGRVYRSSDGITWTRITTAPSGLHVDCAFGNQIFVLLSASGAIYTSVDLDVWTQTRSADTPTAEWTALLFDSGRFLAVSAVSIYGAPARIISSITGSGWIIAPAIPQQDWYDIVCGGNICVSVGGGGSIMTSSNASTSIYGSALYSEPNSPSNVYMMLVGYNKVGFYSPGHSGKSIGLGSGNYVTQQSTIVQANNYVYLFRGDDAKPLYWNGDWNTTFALVPDTTLPATYNSIPNSNQATYYQNRLWIRSGKDSLAASDVLAFSDYDPLANEFNLNTGNSDYVVATFPFGLTSLVCFKNKSIQLLQQVDGALTDVIVTEITRQVGLVGINAVTSVGPDLAYVSYGNINLLTLTSTNNAMQHKTLPLSSRIRRIMNRVNWQVGYKISLGYWNNKLYVSLPLDNSLFCNAVVVYNFITESWYGEWNFSPDMNMCIQGWQVNDYLGLQRLHAITEDGRIFVTDEGQNDISGTTVSEISFELLTRAYSTAKMDNERRGMSINHFQRRMYADLSTNRPEFSVSSYTDGANEESVLLTDQTYTRSQSWRFNDASYDLTNANDDYNRAYRRDYSTGPDSVQSGTGFQPEMTQDIRIPMITQRQGRLSWLSLTNTQGYLMLKSIGFENRAGQRGSTIQA